MGVDAGANDALKARRHARQRLVGAHREEAANRVEHVVGDEAQRTVLGKVGARRVLHNRAHARFPECLRT